MIAIRKFLYLSLLFNLIFSSFFVLADEVKQGDQVTIMTPNVNARLCPSPSCGSSQHITRIPQGTVLIIDGIMVVKTGMLSTKWFEVTFNGKRGWISMYDTDKQ